MRYEKRESKTKIPIFFNHRNKKKKELTVKNAKEY